MAPQSLAKVLVGDGEGKYLILRSSEWPENPKRSLQPDLPGGLVEDGETALEGAIRELEEETGIQVKPEDMQLVRTARETHGEKLYERSVYFVTIKNPKIALSWEHDAYWWETANEILNLKMREPYPELFKFMHEQGYLV